MPLNRPDVVTDFGQFTAQRAQARNDDPAVVRKAAQQFEALFTQQMLKSMRSAKLADDVMGGGQTEFYQDIFDQQMSVHLSSGKGLGLADVLVKQLRGHQAPAPAVDTTKSMPVQVQLASSQHLSLKPYVAQPHGQQPYAAPARHAAIVGRVSVLTGAAPTGFGASASGRLSERPLQGADTAAFSGRQSREAFVREVWPHAERAGRELGVSPRVLVAQAALETGWGRSTIRDASGELSLNFFGIKADKRWEGPRVNTKTTEFVDGQSRREDANFRAYGSTAESFDNYVSFLKTNPRYAQALRHGGDMRHFVQGLQNAGYATDPAYAQKILKIASGRAMNAAIAGSGRHSV